jgi:putative ABC transport system permease protein
MYSLLTLWHERSRFLPGILAVGFSAVLIALQTGLLLGLFTIMSIPVDHAAADLWVGYPEVQSVDLGRPIPEQWFARLAAQPEVVRVEPSRMGFAGWSMPERNVVEVGMVIGTRLDPGSLGAVDQLTPELRARLSRLGTIVVDEAEFERLGLEQVGETAEVYGQRVQVVGTVSGLKSLGAPYLFCSLETARQLLRQPEDQTTYLLARCNNPADADAVASRLRQRYHRMSAFTKDQFSFRSRWHWLTKTKAGIALGLAALLGLLVGAVVTSQTLYAATSASLREYATLKAMGISRRRMRAMVLAQSFWVGIFGVLLAYPVVLLLSYVAELLSAKVLLPLWLLAGTALITLAMAMLAGLGGLRSLRQAEPAQLLR